MLELQESLTALEAEIHKLMLSQIAVLVSLLLIGVAFVVRKRLDQ